MTQLILVRHGQTDWNKANRIQGGLDIPLNESGKIEAEKLAKHLSKLDIDVIYSSKLSRSWETAGAIAKYHGLGVKKIGELNELNQGLWQGLLVSEIKKRYKKQFNMWSANPLSVRPPKGESIDEAHKRVTSAAKKIIAKYKGHSVCIVSHEIINTLLKCYFHNLDIEKVWDNLHKQASWEIIQVG